MEYTAVPILGAVIPGASPPGHGPVRREPRGAPEHLLRRDVEPRLPEIERVLSRNIEYEHAQRQAELLRTVGDPTAAMFERVPSWRRIQKLGAEILKANYVLSQLPEEQLNRLADAVIEPWQRRGGDDERNRRELLQQMVNDPDRFVYAARRILGDPLAQVAIAPVELPGERAAEELKLRGWLTSALGRIAESAEQAPPRAEQLTGPLKLTLGPQAAREAASLIGAYDLARAAALADAYAVRNGFPVLPELPELVNDPLLAELTELQRYAAVEAVVVAHMMASPQLGERFVSKLYQLRRRYGVATANERLYLSRPKQYYPAAYAAQSLLKKYIPDSLSGGGRHLVYLLGREPSGRDWWARLDPIIEGTYLERLIPEPFENVSHMLMYAGSRYLPPGSNGKRPLERIDFSVLESVDAGGQLAHLSREDRAHLISTAAAFVSPGRGPSWYEHAQMAARAGGREWWMPAVLALDGFTATPSLELRKAARLLAEFDVRQIARAMLKNQTPEGDPVAHLILAEEAAWYVPGKPSEESPVNHPYILVPRQMIYEGRGEPIRQLDWIDTSEYYGKYLPAYYNADERARYEVDRAAAQYATSVGMPEPYDPMRFIRRLPALVHEGKVRLPVAQYDAVVHEVGREYIRSFWLKVSTAKPAAREAIIYWLRQNGLPQEAVPPVLGAE